MKIVYSLPHPTDRLDVERAGHIVRAKALLRSLEHAGHHIHRLEAANAVHKSGTTAASVYRRMVKRLLPRSVALRLRDIGRVTYGKVFANHLTETVQRIRPDVILETHIVFSLAGVTASKRTGIPYVVDDFSPPYEEGTFYGDGIGLKQTAEGIIRQVVSQARLVIAVSDHLRAYLQEVGCPDEKIVLIPNGFDADTFHRGVDGVARRSALGIAADAAVVAFVGSFLRFHRIDLLVESFAGLDAALEAHLLLIGDGPEVPNARAHLDALGLSHRAHFVGRVPHADVPSYVAAADVSVLPGALDFGNSMKLWEYMALGRPTIAPDLDTIARVVEHGRHVLLFQDGNADGLRKALSTVLGSAALRASLSENAAREAVRHTWQARAEALVVALRERHIVAAA